MKSILNGGDQKSTIKLKQLMPFNNVLTGVHTTSLYKLWPMQENVTPGKKLAGFVLLAKLYV